MLLSQIGVSSTPSLFISLFSISHSASVWALGMRYVSLTLGRSYGATNPFLYLSYHLFSFVSSLSPNYVCLGSGNEVCISYVGSAPWSNRPPLFTSLFSISHLESVWGLGMRYVSLELGRPQGATDPFLHLSYSCVRSVPWSNRPCDLLANTFETTKSSFF